ncbi:hypothetical protein [Streptomyces sp. NPDC048242]|uniref:hypothetical protein n=1 Tax=Streptomyces sp. NPDC048242 TaxID=3155026 RepID=UPI003429901E
MEHSAAQPPPAPLLAPLFGAVPFRPIGPESSGQISFWLAGADLKPKRVLRRWEEGWDQLLPLGVRFAAVRIPGSIMHAVVVSDDVEAIAVVARDTLRGPVIAGMYARQRTYWALVPWRPQVYWPDYLKRAAPLLGPDSYLNVPPPACAVPPNFWVAPPRYRYDLCSREQVFNLIMRGWAGQNRPASAGSPAG